MSEPLPEKNFKLLNIFTGIFVGVLVLIPSMSSKFIAIGPLSVVGGTLIFPVTFIINDIITEVYGYKLSRRVIWTGMAMQIFAAFFYWIIAILPSPDFWSDQAAYTTILGQAPRIVVASLTAYFFGEFVNSAVLSKMKYSQKGGRGGKQAARFVASSVVGEGVDSVIFMTVAFLGVIPMNTLIAMILTLWGVKVAYEILLLPISMPFANWVKKIEGIDVIDEPKKTSYNPFGVN